MGVSFSATTKTSAATSEVAHVCGTHCSALTFRALGSGKEDEEESECESDSESEKVLDTDLVAHLPSDHKFWLWSEAHSRALVQVMDDKYQLFQPELVQLVIGYCFKHELPILFHYASFVRAMHYRSFEVCDHWWHAFERASAGGSPLLRVAIVCDSLQSGDKLRRRIGASNAQPTAVEMDDEKWAFVCCFLQPMDLLFPDIFGEEAAAKCSPLSGPKASGTAEMRHVIDSRRIDALLFAVSVSTPNAVARIRKVYSAVLRTANGWGKTRDGRSALPTVIALTEAHSERSGSLRKDAMEFAQAIDAPLVEVSAERNFYCLFVFEVLLRELWYKQMSQ